MDTFFTQSSMAPFTAALLIIAGLLVIEVVAMLVAGMGLSDLGELVLDTTSLVEGSALNWLIVRGLPLSVAIIVWLTSFGVSGILLQLGAVAVRGEALPIVLACAIAWVVGWAGLRWIGRALLPLFDTTTTAVHLSAFVGRKAVILSPRCTTALLAEVQVTDVHGGTHSIMVSPAVGQGDFLQGDEVVLHELTAHGFTVRRA